MFNHQPCISCAGHTRLRATSASTSAPWRLGTRTGGCRATSWMKTRPWSRFYGSGPSLSSSMTIHSSKSLRPNPPLCRKMEERGPCWRHTRREQQLPLPPPWTGTSCPQTSGGHSINIDSLARLCSLYTGTHISWVGHNSVTHDLAFVRIPDLGNIPSFLISFDSKPSFIGGKATTDPLVISFMTAQGRSDWVDGRLRLLQNRCAHLFPPPYPGNVF
jgi:hypothetical protein